MPAGECLRACQNKPYMMLQTVNTRTQCWCAGQLDSSALNGRYLSTEGVYEVIDISPMLVGSESKTTDASGSEVIAKSLANGYYQIMFKKVGKQSHEWHLRDKCSRLKEFCVHIINAMECVHFVVFFHFSRI